jgi:glycosyltransferase involved in cell wall biosynthesis
VLLEAFRALRHLGLELHLVTKDRLPPEPGVFIYNNLEANSQPLKGLYHTCDIFALPTFGDCLPRVLSEAGVSGMAIISTNVAAIPEFVRNGETGLTVPVGNAASLTQALRDLATNPAFRMVLGERAMAHASRYHDAPTNASRLLGLLKAEANAARRQTCRFDRTLRLVGSHGSWRIAFAAGVTLASAPCISGQGNENLIGFNRKSIYIKWH